MKITIKEQSENRERKKKKIIFKSGKEFGKGSFIYDIRNIHNFGLSKTHSWKSLIGIL